MGQMDWLTKLSFPASLWAVSEGSSPVSRTREMMAVIFLSVLAARTTPARLVPHVTAQAPGPWTVGQVVTVHAVKVVHIVAAQDEHRIMEPQGRSLLCRIVAQWHGLPATGGRR